MQPQSESDATSAGVREAGVARACAGGKSRRVPMELGPSQLRQLLFVPELGGNGGKEGPFQAGSPVASGGKAAGGWGCVRQV